MKPPIDFYFDFSSPYGYLLSEKIDALARQHGRTVTWRPVLLFAVLRALGLPAPMEHPAKRSYMTADFERSAAFLGVEYRLPPAFPVVTQHAARACYLLQEAAPEAAVPFAQKVLRAYFREGHDIADLAFVAQLVCDTTARLGPPAAVCEQVQGAAAKALLQGAIAAAVERQVFGSPFVIIDGDPFFGADRLPQIAARLAAAPSNPRSSA